MLFQNKLQKKRDFGIQFDNNLPYTKENRFKIIFKKIKLNDMWAFSFGCM